MIGEQGVTRWWSLWGLVAIAGIVVTIIMSAYSGLIKVFHIHSGNAAQVRKMIVCKKQ
ncbi:MAG: hypothetical protein U5L04_05790 [Trueperaceae bacterium]|nr:hypothetical protein [Trueperaceae bacterium]